MVLCTGGGNPTSVHAHLRQGDTDNDEIPLRKSLLKPS